MKKIIGIVIFLIASKVVMSQNIAQKLAQVIKQFEADSQMRHAIVGICVADAKTGNTLYAHNAQFGLAPASTQKIFTSVAALDLLGIDYRYKTEVGYKGERNKISNPGFLVVKPSGDPTFGSWRYNSTKPDHILGNFVNSIKEKGIKKVYDRIIWLDSNYSKINTPRGWIFEDIGNYYGAGARAFNWLENQYDIVLRSGKKIGDAVEVVAMKPSGTAIPVLSNVKSAEKGSGDNAYVFAESYWDFPIIEGTIPVNEDSFVISASLGDPKSTFRWQWKKSMKQQGIEIEVYPHNGGWRDTIIEISNDPENYLALYTHLSPSLDSINYWFLKKSVNLYGEALIKTFAYKQTGFGSTEKGVELLKDFWSQHGIDNGAVNVMDGSGLSPQNRVTADAEVKVLQYAKTRPWFNSFYNALPEFNGMKMKSGAIGGARAYTGYHTASNGAQYIFSIIVNNYTGSSSEAVKKIYKVLDVLK